MITAAHKAAGSQADDTTESTDQEGGLQRQEGPESGLS